MILYNQKDCLTTRKNLGLPDCIIQEGRLTGKILVPKGWSLDLTSGTFDKDYVNEQIQLGNFIPILGAVEVTNNTPEATTEEYQGGVMSVVRNGLPQFAFKYLRGGWKFANALNTYNSFQAYDVLFVFSSGAIAGAKAGNNLTGFDLGMINSGTYMFTDGNVSSSVTTSIQIINEAQFNRDVALLDSSILDFNVNTEIFPITDIVMTGRADVSDNKVYFKASFDMNQATLLGGIAIDNLRCTIDGVADTIVALSLTFNSLTSEWEFEPTATLTTGDAVVVELYDSVNSVAVAKIGQRYYKGATAEITPVA
jgi:ribosome-associated toxin RatA of RatAB toxin-antitoxin module